MLKKRKIGAIAMAALSAVFVVGCKKKPAPTAPPPPPPPSKVDTTKPTPGAPSIQFSAEPTSIQRGQSATLRWSVTGDANNISIDQGLGTVQANGTRRVFPSDTVTYTLSASGPGGTRTATATVTVAAPPPPPPPPPTAPKSTLEQRLSGEVQDAYFDYDKSDIREDARAALTRNADALKGILSEFPGSSIVVEGHCDERGSAEYNLGLGDRRATSAKEFLVQLGVPADRLKTISYGKERPQCTEANEDCWQKNRRAHFAPGQ
jgi:peptidoglycan-associated lipoprotein